MSIVRLSGGLSPADGSDPRTFPAIFNAAADEIDGKVDRSGDTMSGVLSSPNVFLGVDTATSDTIALDFSTGDGFITRAISGSVTVTASNYGPGRTKTMRLVGGASVASLTVPSDWVFVGQDVAASIAAGVTCVLTVTSFGTAAADAVAAWVEEA
jgi:hypothetical protein